MTWFTLTIFSVFALAVAELTQQHLLNLKNAFNERTSAILTFLIQVFLVVPFIFALGLSGQLFSVFSLNVFPKMLAVTFIASIAMIFYFKSFRVKNISISTIFNSFSAIVSTSLGIIFFSESSSHLKFLGILLILLAIIVMNYKNAILEKNHLYGLFAGSIYGISYTLDKSIVQSVHPLIYIFWICLMIAVWAFIIDNKSVRNSLKGKALISYKPIAISGASYFLFNVFTFSAYRLGGEVGRIDAINNSEIFLIILFEFFILRHTQGTVRKLFSAGLAILGVFILGLVK